MKDQIPAEQIEDAENPPAEDVAEDPRPVVKSDTDRAIVFTTVEGDPPQYVARCPHVPDLKGTHPDKESRAVDDLINQVREYRAGYESRGEDAPWLDFSVDGLEIPPGAQARRLSGLCPPAPKRKTPEKK